MNTFKLTLYSLQFILPTQNFNTKNTWTLPTYFIINFREFLQFTSIICLYDIMRIVFLMEVHGVICDVRN
jgi:hypothetical protein